MAEGNDFDPSISPGAAGATGALLLVGLMMIFPSAFRKWWSRVLSNFGSDARPTQRGKAIAEEGGFHPSQLFVYVGEGSIPKNVVQAEVHPSVTEIPDRLFQDCWKLELVLLHEGLMKIGKLAFDSCSSLRSLRCPSTVTEICVGAFRGCWDLSTVGLPECLESIEDETFWECTSLEELQIPASVARIGDYAFYNCTNLALVELCEGLRMIGDIAFADCRSLESLRIPSSVVEIGECAFADCINLVLVQLQEDLPMIKRDAFRGCSLKSFHFARLFERMEVISVDDRTKSIFDSRFSEMTLAITRANNEEEDEATAFREKCKKSLGRAQEVLTYLELKGAAPVLELALWKAKIEGEGGEGLREDSVNDADGRRNPSDDARGFLAQFLIRMPLVRERERCKAIKNINKDPRLACRVKCGADVVLPEVLKFFTYSMNWPQLNGEA